MQRNLFHATSFQGFKSLEIGAVVTLRPGSQNAQGLGVYFSESSPDIRASDSVHYDGLAAIFDVSIETNKTWYSSKNCRDRAKGRPKTWHSTGRKVQLSVIEKSVVDGIIYYKCDGIVVA